MLTKQLSERSGCVLIFGKFKTPYLYKNVTFKTRIQVDITSIFLKVQDIVQET